MSGSEQDAPFVAPALLRLRFPNARRCATPAIGAIDHVNGVGHRIPDASVAALITRGSPIFVAGWVTQPELAGAPAAVFVTIDDAYAAEARIGLPRPDVAEIHGRRAEAAGFEAVVPSHAVAPGLHTLGVALVHDTTTYSVGPQRVITIVAGSLKTTITTPYAEGLRIELDTLDAEESTDGAAVRYGSALFLRGWAIDEIAGQPCAGVYAIVDDEFLFRARYCGERQDVADTLNNPALLYCAFEVRIDSALVGIGDHVIRIGALSADGSTRCERVTTGVRIR
jgi:hypothetical protein